MKNTYKNYSNKRERQGVYQLFCKKEDRLIDVITSDNINIMGLSASLNVVMQILDVGISFYVRRIY